MRHLPSRLVVVAGVLALACAPTSWHGVVVTTAARGSAQAKLPGPVRLWPDGAPGAVGAGDADTPALYPFLPPARTRTGAGVLVIPGPGAARIDRDGVRMAAWLNARGIAAFVLRYRAAPRYPRAAAIADVARAIQYARSHAADFAVAPERIGAVGFGPGAGLAADVGYAEVAPGEVTAADPVSRVSSAMAFVALIHGPVALTGPPAARPATFLSGSSRRADGEDGMIELWARLREARVPVDAHFPARAAATFGPGQDDPPAGSWAESFYSWMRYRGYLTNAARVPLRGMAFLDGRPLPHGYVVFTPVDTTGAGPIVARVLNSTAGVPIGQFSVPAAQGPVLGRYRVAVHQNANRWLSNAFTAALTKDPAFGHSRILSPSIDGLRVYSKVRPSDKDSYVVTITAAGAEDLRIEVFSKAPPGGTIPNPATTGSPDNPGLAAYAVQLAHTPDPVPGIPQPILLWPDGAPGAVPDASGAFTDEDKPSLYAFPAPAATNTGAALLVLPGGAFTNRAIDQEGIQVARWLNGQGISAFVLHYRIRPNYAGAVSSMDAYRAMRYVRSRAASYKVAPDRIGVIGFSAGAELEGDAFFNKVAATDPAAADPIDRVPADSNFNVLIYGGRNVANPAAAPPTFMFVTLEDGGNHLAPQINALNGLRAAGIPVEAHWYQEGPHGTALAIGDPQLGQWPGLMVSWLKSQGFLSRSAR